MTLSRLFIFASFVLITAGATSCKKTISTKGNGCGDPPAPSTPQLRLVDKVTGEDLLAGDNSAPQEFTASLSCTPQYQLRKVINPYVQGADSISKQVRYAFSLEPISNDPSCQTIYITADNDTDTVTFSGYNEPVTECGPGKFVIQRVFFNGEETFETQTGRLAGGYAPVAGFKYYPLKK